MNGIPRINEPIVVRDPDGRSYRSRVQGIDADDLTIAQPLDLPADHDCEVGRELLVTSVSPRGVVVVPVELVNIRAEGLVRLWVLRITGDVWHEQRRDYVRVPIGGRVTLKPAEAAQIPGLDGQLTDISEAALRCTVDTDAAEALLARDGAVLAAFSIADQPFELPGRIHTRRPDPKSTQRTELVMLFAQPVVEADTLRRLVFAQQLLNRAIASKA